MINVPNQNIAINFNYTVDNQEGLTCGQRMVVCQIVDASDKNKRTVLTGGSARLAPGDTFVKEEGRKIALRRAIKDFDRQARREIWQAYFNRNQTGQ